MNAASRNGGGANGERPAIRVFISSPSDVRPERLIAERVVQRLDREFAYHFHIEPVLWEREPLVASAHFQDGIVPPHETDIVAVILWSRLGMKLPADKYRGALSGGPVTGTEWEFEDALASYRVQRLPDLLLYRKKADITGSLADEAVVRERLDQKRLVEDFMLRWTRSADGSAFTAASWEFEDAAAFEELLEAHLRELIRRRLTTAEEGPGGIRWHQGSPFRGLQSFDLDHAQVFFGRTRARNEVRELLARQAERGSAFVLVIGASGSGKSSLVKAGVLADLRLPGMIGRVALCRYAILRPADGGGDPIAALAAVLLTPDALPELGGLQYDAATLAGQLRDNPRQVAFAVRQGLAAAGQAAKLTEIAEARLLVVVDQLEELFTLGSVTPAAREGFVAALAALARSGLVWVIATLRSDFFDRLETVPHLLALAAGEARYVLAAPNDGELGQIITRPAREAGVRFEADAVRGISLDEVLREAAGHDRNALPLLSYVLDLLWQHRRSADGMLTVAAYDELGGLDGAIGRRAEEVFTALPADVQAAFPQVLRALVAVGQGAEDRATARSAPQSAFPPGTPASALVAALLGPEARLLVADGAGAAARLRVAHEAVLTHWRRARRQIAADRKDLQLRGRLEQAAALWEAAAPADRPALLLNPGLPLSEAEDLLARRGDELDPAVVAFVTISGTTARAAERRRLRRLRVVAAGFAVLAAGAVAASGFAWLQRNEAVTQRTFARHQAEVALSRQLVAQSAGHLDDALDVGLLLAIEAMNASDTFEARAVLLKGLGRYPRIQEYLRGQIDQAPVGARYVRAFGLAISPDGGLLAAVGNSQKTVTLFDPRTGRAIRQLSGGHTDAVESVAFSRDGKLLASGGEDYKLVIWDPFRGRPLRTIGGTPDTVTAIAFGSSLENVYYAAGDKLYRWNWSGTAPPQAFSTPDLRSIERVYVSARETYAIVSGFRNAQDDINGRMTVWINLATGQAIGHPQDGMALALSPSYDRVALARKGRVQVYNADTQVALDPPITGTFPDPVELAGAFSPSGRELAVSADNTIAIWNLKTATATDEPWHGHVESIDALVFDPDGAHLTSLAADDSIIYWNLAAPRSLARRFASTADGWSLAFSPATPALASAGDKTTTVWDSNSGQVTAVFQTPDLPDADLSFSPDGRLLLLSDSRDVDDTTRKPSAAAVFDLQSHARLLTLPDGRRGGPLAISPDGGRIALVDGLNGVVVWDRSSRTFSPVLATAPGNISALAFTAPDQIAIGDAKANILVCSLASSPAACTPIEGTTRAPVGLLALPDQNLLLSTGYETLSAWDLTAHRRVSNLVHPTGIGAPAIVTAAPEAQLVAWSDFGRPTFQTLDSKLGREFGDEMRAPAGREGLDSVSGLAFRPDGRILASMEQNTVYLWDFDISSWRRRACAIANRNLTIEEWDRYLGPAPYRKTCGDLPRP